MKRILVLAVLIVSLLSVVPVSAAESVAPEVDGAGITEGGLRLVLPGLVTGGVGNDDGGLVTPMGAEYPNPSWQID